MPTPPPLSVQPLAQQPSLNVAQAPQQQINSVGTLGNQQEVKPQINFPKIAQDIPKARQLAPNQDMAILEDIVKKNPPLSSDTTEAFKRATTNGIDPVQTATQILDHIQQKYTPQPEKTGLLQSIAQGIAKTPIQVAKALYSLPSAAREIVASDPAEKQAQAEEFKKRAFGTTDAGYFGQVEAPKYTTTEALGKGFELGSYAIGGGEVKNLGEQALKQSVLQTAKQGARVGLAQGLAGGLGSGLQQDNPTVGKTLLSTAEGGATGALMGGVLGAAGGTLTKIKPLITGEVSPTQALSNAKNAVLSPVKAITNTVSPDVESSLIRAIKPGKNNTNFVSDLKNSIPFIHETSVITGKPITNLESLDNVITDTKKRVWSDYQNILGPNAKSTIDGNQIADNMVSALDKRFITQNPEKAIQINALADTYRRPIKLDEAEEFLQSANNDLHAYYAKNKVNQLVAAADPEKGYVVKEAEGLRSALYSKLDELTGKDAGKVKKTYGSLTNLQNEVQGRKNVNARQAPVSLGQQFSRVSAVGDLIRGIDLAKPGETVANIGSGIGKIALGNHMRNLNDSDYLINNAFSKLYKNPPVKVIQPISKPLELAPQPEKPTLPLKRKPTDMIKNATERNAIIEKTVKQRAAEAARKPGDMIRSNKEVQQIVNQALASRRFGK